MTDSNQPEESLVLVEPRGRKFRFLLLGLVMVAASVLVVATDGSAAGWLGLVFFGLCTVAIGLNLVLPSRLELNTRGFRFIGMGRRSSVFDWRLSRHFRAWSPARGTTMIAFDYDGDARRYRGLLARLNRALTSGNVALPTTYGLTPSELVHLLSDWQRRYGEEHPTA